MSKAAGIGATFTERRPLEVVVLNKPPGPAMQGRNIAEMGGTVFAQMPTRQAGYGLATGGSIIHEVGGTRMGSDPSTSVLNKNCQAHDVKNLFVADGGPMPSQADKNCTWTILALSMRTAEFIAEARKAGTV